MRVKGVLIFVCVILFVYIKGLYDTNEFLRDEIMFLEYDKIDLETKIRKLEKENKTLKIKKVEKPVKKKKPIPKKEVIIEVEEVLNDSVIQSQDTTKN
jgi:hypothetical protein